MTVVRKVATVLFLLGSAISVLYCQQREEVISDVKCFLEGSPVDNLHVVESYGYPLPTRLLQWREQLGLSREQIAKIEELQKNLAISVSVKGSEVFEAEKELSNQLQQGTISDKQLRLLVDVATKKRGEYRYLFLQMYTRIKKLLNQEQIERYKELYERERNKK